GPCAAALAIGRRVPCRADDPRITARLRMAGDHAPLDEIAEPMDQHGMDRLDVLRVRRRNDEREIGQGPYVAAIAAQQRPPPQPDALRRLEAAHDIARSAARAETDQHVTWAAEGL